MKRSRKEDDQHISHEEDGAGDDEEDVGEVGRKYSCGIEQSERPLSFSESEIQNSTRY